MSRICEIYGCDTEVHFKPLCYKHTAKEKRERRRKYCLARLGGKCDKCGSNERLEFHHIDKSTKSFDITSGLQRSMDSINTELDKCILLCHDCHLGKTHNERDYRINNYSIGTIDIGWEQISKIKLNKSIDKCHDM